MSKKRHTRAPLLAGAKKDIPMLMRFTKDNYMALIKDKE